MNLPEYNYVETYKEWEKKRYKELLKKLGTNINFDDNKWICDKRIRHPSEPTHKVTIYFTTLIEKYVEITKYYVLLKLLSGNTIGTIKKRISNLSTFFYFLMDENNSCDLDKCDIYVAAKLKEYLENRGYAISTCNDTWTEASMLMKTMDGYENKRLKNPFSQNPFAGRVKIKEKYIPEEVVKQLDEVFGKEEIDHYLKCAYWILRLIPSRISEVIGMKLDCLKSYLDHYVLFIPTWKQNGGNIEAVLRSIHIKDEGIGKMLLDVIREQQKIAESLQGKMYRDKGHLFTYQSVYHYKDGSVSIPLNIGIATSRTINYQLQRICEKYDIRDKEGNLYIVTSHQFRHNGITDRLEAGFTLEQIADMTGHHGNAMIWNAYSHLDLKPKTILEKQVYVLEEPQDKGNPYVLFGGRILNMDEQNEKRLLKNIRALKVKGGICSDVTGCKSDMWNCLDCEHFIPDCDQLKYFQEQKEGWQEKAKKFVNMPIVHQNALQNARLFEKIISKISGGKHDEQQ